MPAADFAIKSFQKLYWWFKRGTAFREKRIKLRKATSF